MKNAYEYEESAWERILSSTTRDFLVSQKKHRKSFSSSRKPRSRLSSHVSSETSLCVGEDSNLHGLLRLLLRQVRIPIPPPTHFIYPSPPSWILLRLNFCRHKNLSRHLLIVARNSRHIPPFESKRRQSRLSASGQNSASLRVRPVGFEPTTVRLRGDCSTN